MAEIEIKVITVLALLGFFLFALITMITLPIWLKIILFIGGFYLAKKMLPGRK